MGPGEAHPAACIRARGNVAADVSVNRRSSDTIQTLGPDSCNMERKKAPRPPNSAAIEPAAQCGGDWGFLLAAAIEFVESSIAKVESSIGAPPSTVADNAHTIKTTAELLSMCEVAEAAFCVQEGVYESSPEVDLMSAQGALLEKLLGLKIVLSLPFAKEKLASVQGYFDDMSSSEKVLALVRRRRSSIASETEKPPMLGRISVVCDDPTMHSIISRWVAPFVASEGDEAVIFVHSPTCPFLEKMWRHVPTVIVGDLDDHTHAMIHGELCKVFDTVRSPPCPEEIMRRLFGLRRPNV